MSRGLVFAYKHMDGRFRPIIPIELSHGGESVRYEVLVDSGADMFIIDADIGRAIGLNIEDGEPFEVGGLVGKMQTGYKHIVTVVVKNAIYQTKIGFMDNMRDGSYGMVGQKGFFDRFAIKFDYSEHKLILHKKQWA